MTSPAREHALRIRRERPGVTLIDLAEEVGEACVLEFAEMISRGSKTVGAAARAYIGGQPVTRSSPDLPYPRASETWRPSRPGSRAKARHIVWCGDVPWKTGWRPDYPTVGWAHDPANPEFPDRGGHDSWLSLNEFMRWARKREARPA